MSNINRLVASIIHFLGDQLRNESLKDDGRESLEVAIQCLETAYGISASDAHLLPSRGLKEIFDEAVESEPIKDAEEEASPQDKEEAERLKNEGNQLMKREDFEEALKCYTKAIQLDKHNAVFYCNRAAAFSKLNNHTFALEDCQRSIEIDPSYSKAYGRMGLAYASLNDHKRAKELYEKAIELDPQNDSYRNNLRIAEEKIQEQQRENPFASMFGGNVDFESLISNPAIMNIAQQFISNGNAQNLFGQVMGGMNPEGAASAAGSAPGSAPGLGGGEQAPPGGEGPGGANLVEFLRAGQQMAQQIQQNNPELLETIRRSFGEMGKKDDNKDN